MRFTRSHVVILIAAGALAVGGCSSSADAGGQESSRAPASSTAGSDAGIDPSDAGQGDATEVDSEFAMLSKVLVGSLNPEPTFSFTGEKSVEYTFPSGSYTDEAAFSNCQIALGALGMDSDVTVTYPDGSAVCAELIN